ncbi:MAG: NAD(P)-dependent alcohol dehydrogenase [Fibrella sp.]|nr:NAD(P)-dependent alcohol dehydrogenase [Armatimonadota bacterium]
MKSIQIQNTWGLDSLTIIDLPEPEAPKPGHVLIRVHAASLNYRDWMMVNGWYNPNQPLPLVPLSDGAGEVVGVGEGVTRWKIGDRVAGAFTQDWHSGEFKAAYWQTSTLGGPLPGMLQEHVTLSETGLVKIPDHLSYEEAATLPCAAVTAWNGLFVSGNLQAGETVLVQGTGGVSLFALQFAKLAGARVIATSSSDAKLARAKESGADAIINYKTTPEWGVAARDMTEGGLGVDHVIEVGGAGTLPQSFQSVKAGGHIALIGVLTVQDAAPIDPISILLKSITVRGILVGSREMFENMNRAISQARLKPVIDRVFPFSETRAALAHLSSGSHFGKVVIRIAE